MKKRKTSKKVAKKTATPAKAKYFFAIGRRKTAQAKAKLFTEGQGRFLINDRDFWDYFPTLSLQKAATDPLAISGLLKKVNVEIKVRGGGIMGQAEASALAISRALVKSDPNKKTVLKKEGMLTRDARKKERKKPGLKRARRAPQWQKR